MSLIDTTSINLVDMLTTTFTWGILTAVSGWVRRGGNLRTLSGLRGSSSKEIFLGAAGLPAQIQNLWQSVYW